mgnify:FL=1
MKKRSILLIILMVVSFTLTYIFGYNGFNTLVKTLINYKESSNVEYRVYLKDNNIYKSNILDMNKKYITELVDYIDMDFNYKIKFDRYISGYYSYLIEAQVVAYEDDINDPLWIKEYNELDSKVEVLNKNKIDTIDIKDTVRIGYKEYKKVIDDFKEEYGLDISGYLLVKFKMNKTVDFSGLTKEVNDDRIIKVIVPLTYDTFKINVINDNNKSDSYYEFTTKSDVNYLFLIFAALSGSIGMSLLILVIKEMIDVSKMESNYNKELKKILKDNRDIIVNVNKLYNKKKYNLIYVDSFIELMDVYNRVESPMSFKEIEKNKEAIFLIIENDNAWIYRLVNKKKEK